MCSAAAPTRCKNSVGTKQLKNAAVTNKKIKKKTIKNAKLKKETLKANRIADGTLTEKQIADGTLTGAKIADGSIDDTKISDYEVFGDSWIRATATANSEVGAAKIPLASKGQLSFYGKCWRDGTPETFAEAYVETSAAGAIFEATEEGKMGGNSAADFLNPATAEDSRDLSGGASATGAEARIAIYAVRAASPDGTSLDGRGYVAAKQGELGGGNGLYGSGNVCLFGGFLAG